MPITFIFEHIWPNPICFFFQIKDNVHMLSIEEPQGVVKLVMPLSVLQIVLDRPICGGKQVKLNNCSRV